MRLLRRLLTALLLFMAVYGIINGMEKMMLTESRYELTSPKVTRPVTIAVVADLHNTRYGQAQEKLLTRIRAAKPDLVAITGDAFHARLNERNTLDALTALAKEYPCYFVTGNHECNSADYAAITSAVRALGVTVLSGETADVVANGQPLQLCGLDDFDNQAISHMHTQLVRVSEAVREEQLSILLVHRPERFSDYLPCGFDLILAGHAHGGQWRIPGARNGLIAPGQGWFPQYAGGLYAFGEQTMCVSRGLSNKPLWLARFGNPPELLFVTVTPA